LNASSHSTQPNASKIWNLTLAIILRRNLLVHCPSYRLRLGLDRFD
jgi:hypothetical protein